MAMTALASYRRSRLSYRAMFVLIYFLLKQISLWRLCLDFWVGFPRLADSAHAAAGSRDHGLSYSSEV